MTDSVKLIWSRIPKKRLSSIVTFIVGYFAKLLLDFFLREEPFKLSEQSYQALIGSAVLLIAYYFVAFVYYSIRMVSELNQKVHAISLKLERSGLPSPPRTRLPDSKMIIGTLKKESLNADIQAKIVLKENTRPDTENFLKRISMGNPYCSKCMRPMDDIAADWMMFDLSPVGYNCPNCQTSFQGHYDEILKDGQALVRKDYEHYWRLYKSKIDEITNGRRDDFALT